MSKLSELTRITSYVRHSGGSRIAGKVILGASLLSALFGVSSYISSFSAEKEI
jgi:hypothetical protein